MCSWEDATEISRVYFANADKIKSVTRNLHGLAEEKKISAEMSFGEER